MQPCDLELEGSANNHTPDAPPQIKVSIPFDKAEHRGKIVKDAIIFVTDSKKSGGDEGSSSDSPVECYAAVVTSTPADSAKKVSISYVNDDEDRETTTKMIFCHTVPAHTGTVWFGQIQYIVPTGLVTKEEVDGQEDDQGGPLHEYHIDVSSAHEESMES